MRRLVSQCAPQWTFTLVGGTFWRSGTGYHFGYVPGARQAGLALALSELRHDCRIDLHDGPVLLE